MLKMKKNTKFSTEKDRKIVTILGINVLGTSRNSLLTGIEERLSYNSPIYVVTPNPEQVLSSMGNPLQKQALNSADYAIPDGVGLVQASKFLSLPLPKNKIIKYLVAFFQGLRIGLATFLDRGWLFSELKPIRGREFFIDLIKLANKNKWKVFLLGGNSNEADLSAEKLTSQYKSIRISSDSGPKLDKNGNPVTEVDRKLEKDVIDKVNKFAPQLLFVAFGNPKQEIWIRKNIGRLRIGGAMVVGGTFRYIAGLSKLPPKWMEKVGLEWLYRLIMEPYRIRRIFNAFPVFPLRVFLFKVTGE